MPRYSMTKIKTLENGGKLWGNFRVIADKIVIS